MHKSEKVTEKRVVSTPYLRQRKVTVLPC